MAGRVFHTLRPLEAITTEHRSGNIASREFGAWASRLVVALNKTTVPERGIIFANLTAAQLAANFDATGLGNVDGPYAGYARCNGSNGTPTLADYDADVVALMRLEVTS